MAPSSRPHPAEALDIAHSHFDAAYDKAHNPAEELNSTEVVMALNGLRQNLGIDGRIPFTRERMDLNDARRGAATIIHDAYFQSSPTSNAANGTGIETAVERATALVASDGATDEEKDAAIAAIPRAKATAKNALQKHVEAKERDLRNYRRAVGHVTLLKMRLTGKDDDFGTLENYKAMKAEHRRLYGDNLLVRDVKDLLGKKPAVSQSERVDADLRNWAQQLDIVNSPEAVEQRNDPKAKKAASKAAREAFDKRMLEKAEDYFKAQTEFVVPMSDDDPRWSTRQRQTIMRAREKEAEKKRREQEKRERNERGERKQQGNDEETRVDDEQQFSPEREKLLGKLYADAEASIIARKNQALLSQGLTTRDKLPREDFWAIVDSAREKVVRAELGSDASLRAMSELLTDLEAYARREADKKQNSSRDTKNGNEGKSRPSPRPRG